jgi:broad-specificity NMP kinase
MFLLVTGASGAGKSTVRRLLEAEFAEVLEIAELATLGETPEWNIAWRHRMVERMVRRALEVQREGKHFLLCGDPVPPGEVLAAPSADQLEPLAVCLLDVSEASQRARLMARGDDESLIPQHVAFAEWMRRHVVDHRYRPDVILQNSWSEMRWDRWVGDEHVALPWSSYVIDTTERSPVEVSRLVAKWIRAQGGDAVSSARRGRVPRRRAARRA